MQPLSDLEQALEYVDSVVWSHDEPLRSVFAAARRFASLTSPETIERHRDTIDLFVAEALYEEAIAHNVDARGGTAVESDWPSWDDLGEFGRDHWLSMAVAARLSFLAVLRSVEEGKT